MLVISILLVFQKMLMAQEKSLKNHYEIYLDQQPGDNCCRGTREGISKRILLILLEKYAKKMINDYILRRNICLSNPEF